MGEKGAFFAPFRPMPARVSSLTYASPAWLKGNGNDCYAGYFLALLCPGIIFPFLECKNERTKFVKMVQREWVGEDLKNAYSAVFALSTTASVSFL